MDLFIRKLVSRLPSVKSALLKLAVSHRFREVRPGELDQTSDRLSKAWQAAAVPQRQRDMVDWDLAAYRAGVANPTFDALVDMLTHHFPHLEEKTLLEVGCSSGYYSEVLRSSGLNVAYRGCDYSLPFVELARLKHSSVPFDVEDATSLNYESESFDIVLSGCCLLHIREYEKAVAESARVSREFVIFHRTPILHLGGPAFYTKKAYGTEMLEIHFNEQKLVRLFARCGLDVIDVNTHLSIPAPGRTEPLFYKSYLCRKQ